jgi:hypothetical protein
VGTRLGRLLNRLLLGRLNARDAQGKLRLLTGRGAIFPGSAGTQTTYLAIYVPYGPDSPGSRTLWDIVSALTISSFNQGFSVATVGLLDTQQRLFSAQQIVSLARLLELRVP